MTNIINSFTELNQQIKEKDYSKIILLVDENTHEYCLPELLQNLEIEIPYEIIEIEPGEEMKNIETCQAIWETMIEYNVDRKSLLINLGGGVITDLGGFIASTYKRGIDFINIPTTLLSMVDASIGGKTGIDFSNLKNIIGTFAHAKTICIIPSFLKTLEFTELRSGFAEMLKHGLIADKKHWEDLTSIKELTVENISPLIKRSMEIKSKIVKEDFLEQNIRKTLNFGHTIGHAIESLFLTKNQPIKHGEAVAIGMICETHLSFFEGLINEETKNDIIKNITIFFPSIDISFFPTEEIIKNMMHDKKNIKNEISFSLINEIGHSIYDKKCKKENIIESIEKYK